MSEQVKVEVGQMWQRDDGRQITIGGPLQGRDWSYKYANWSEYAPACWNKLANWVRTEGWTLIQDAPAKLRGSAATGSAIDECSSPQPRQLTPADLCAGMVFEFWGNFGRGEICTLDRQRNGPLSGWYFKERGEQDSDAPLCNPFFYKLISAPAEVAPAKDSHAEHMTAYNEYTRLFYGDNALAMADAHFNKPRPQLPTSQPRFAVGDRFAHADGRFFEVRDVFGAETYEIKRSWRDGECVWDPNGKRKDDEGFIHISGPTYKVPTRSITPSCNCAAQVRPGPHNDWCRTAGRGGG